MPIDIKKNTLQLFRVSLISLIGWCFFFCTITSVFSQNSNNEVSVSFIKLNDSIKATGLCFNVLKISNNSSKTITGNVTFNGPENWHIIAFNDNQTINPGDTALIPVRISPIADAQGGITYILKGAFATRDRQFSANAYLTIPSIMKWDFNTDASKLYFTDISPNANFRVKLSNKGNINELIKLDYKIGKLLHFPQVSTDEYVEFIKLPAFKDTIINQIVTYKNNLSYAEKIRYESNWKESSISAVASTENAKRSASISIKKLSSVFLNQRIQNASPLNFDYQVLNLMSNQLARSNLRINGSILFPKNASLEYLFGVQNIYFNNNANFNLDHQLIYTIRYVDKRNNIEIGYNINGGNLHTINGRGIDGTYKFSPVTQISYAFTQNPYNHSLGEFLSLSTSIKDVSFTAQGTHENNPDGTYNATSALFGAGFTLFKHHTLSFQVLGSKSFYNLSAGRDTSVLGFSYRLNYYAKYKKFDLRFNAVNSANNFIRNSGLQQYNLDSKYLLSNKVTLSFYGNRQYYAASSFPYNFFNPVNYNSTDFLRLMASISSGNITYQFGPNYNGSLRHFFNSFSGYKSEYQTYQPGIWGSATFKINGYGSISPNFTVSNLRFHYLTSDPNGSNYTLNNNIYYSVGINYFDTYWRVNAYYSSGSASDLYRSIQIDTQPITSSSIQFRPSYENYFFNRKLKLSAYVNYAYYMPSGRENTSYNIKTDLFLKNGLNLYLSGFMYSNVRNDELTGRISTKDLNFVVGISKSFNIQQPRQKYYNFKSVFFNDLDGNRMKSDNEPPVSNILVNIEKDRSVSKTQSLIPEVELLSDVNGQIYFENLPQDNYKLSFKPLVNLQSLYFLNGSEQSYFSDKDRTLYIPLAESYKIKGKVILIRDPNSTEGKIDLGGIRITATGMKGETYSVLTDNFGAFIINVPNANKYTVHINNVFGEQFVIDSNETQIQFYQNKTINTDFTFIEKQRGIQFNNGSEIYKFNSLSNESEIIPVDESGNKINSEIKAPSTYSIRLFTLKTYQNPARIKNKLKLKQDVLYSNKNNEYQYFTGDCKSIQDAKSAMKKLGIKGIAVLVDRLELKREAEIVKPQPVKPQPEAAKSNAIVPETKTVNKTQSVVNKTDTPKVVKNVSAPVISKPGVVAKPKPIPAKIDSQKNVKPIPAVSTTKTTIEAPQTPKPMQNNASKIVTVEEKFVQGKPLMIQIDATKEFHAPSYYNLKFGFKGDVYYYEENGVYYYYFGSYNTVDEAKGDIARYGLSGYIVQIDKSLLKK